MASEDLQPLILCMENLKGEEVVLRIEPTDDFNNFLVKTKALLGFDVDLASVTQNKSVQLTDNVYNFLLQNEKTLSSDTVELSTQTLEQILEPNMNGDDLVYVLDDGTQINATQISFDNEDIPIDFAVEKLPFVKLNDDIDEVEIDIPEENIKKINITESPISRWSNKTANCSPNKKGFANSLPFKAVSNSNFNVQTSSYASQYSKLLGNAKKTKTYTTLNPLATKSKSPRSLIKDSYKSCTPIDNTVKETPQNHAVENIKVFSREDVLNLLKNAPVNTSSYTEPINSAMEKRPRHVRKTDPSKPVYKKQEHKVPYLSLDGTLLGNNESRNCFICAKYVTSGTERLYLFDNEDQKLHRSSPLRRHVTTQLKIICTDCLCCYFKSCQSKSSNQDLNPDEYLVIRNNQQYIFQKIKDFYPILLPKVVKKQDYYVKSMEYPKKFCEVKVKEETYSSSDVEVVESVLDIEDHVIENLDEADEDVKAFLGKYQKIEVDELKCRFCNKYFSNLDEVIAHGTEHKHEVDNEEVFPCLLCEYGYANLKWLKGHLKAAHENLDQHSNKNIAIASGVCKKSCNNIAPNINKDEQNAVETAKHIIGGNAQSEAGYDAVITNIKEEVRDSETTNSSNVVQSLTPKGGHVVTTTVVKQECESDTENVWGLSSEVIDEVPAKKKIKLTAQEHNNEPTEQKIVTCDDCNKSFTSKVRLKFHMQFHTDSSMRTEDGHYSCSKCAGAEIFSSESALFDHVHFAHSKQKQWHCPHTHCTKTFYLKATLTKHIRVHTDTRRYVCPTCDKRFFDKQTLDEHSVTHLQRKPFECPVCRKQLTRRSRLRMHVRAHQTRSRADVAACRACTRAFTTLEHAQEHGRTSSACLYAIANEIKQESEEAKLSPRTGAILKRRRSSEKVMSVACSMGNALPSHVRALIRLVRIDKAFRCEYCEDVFYLEEGLNEHRMVHKGMKNPFVCHICKVGFATYSRCTTHKTTHGLYKRPLSTSGPSQALSEDSANSGDFPVVKHFLCEDCGRSYLHWTYLQVHRRMKHSREALRLRCEHCLINFPNSWSIAYHMKKVHGIIKTEKEEVPIKKPSKQDYKIPCRDCDDLLPNKTALYKHRKDKHSDPTLTFDSVRDDLHQCKECGKTYASRTGLEAHSLTHVKTETPLSSNQEPNVKKVCVDCGDTCMTASSSETTQPPPPPPPPPVRRAVIPSLSRSVLPRISRNALGTTVVIEMRGLDPSSEQIMEQLKKANFATNKIVDVTKISYSKGTTGIIPKTQKALLSIPRDIKKPHNLTPIQEPPQVTRKITICAKTPLFIPSSQKGDSVQENVETISKDEQKAENTEKGTLVRNEAENIVTEDLSDITVTQLLTGDIATPSQTTTELDFDESLLV